MTRDEAIAKLKSREAELRQLGVLGLYMFGSTARNEAREDSDVDLFFDYPQEKFGLFQLMDVMERTADILGCKTDVATRDGLHPLLKKRIEASAIRVF